MSVPPYLFRLPVYNLSSSLYPLVTAVQMKIKFYLVLAHTISCRTWPFRIIWSSKILTPEFLISIFYGKSIYPQHEGLVRNHLTQLFLKLLANLPAPAECFSLAFVCFPNMQIAAHVSNFTHFT